MEKYDIFISYRRDGGQMVANHLHYALKGDGYRVFLDTNNLGGGDFDRALLDKVENCKDFVIVLSPGALDRCADAEDWVRKELIQALDYKKNIVPVWLDGFDFNAELPPEIDSVRSKNGLKYDVTHFETDIKKLEQKYLQSKPVNLIRKMLIGALVFLLIAACLFFYRTIPKMEVGETGSLSTAALPESTITPIPKQIEEPSGEEKTGQENINIGSFTSIPVSDFSIVISQEDESSEELPTPTYKSPQIIK